jgi:MFS family permease
LLAGTSLAQVGGWMEEVARGWLVHELTGSAFQLGLIGFIRGITQLLFSPVAGVLVDRLDRRKLSAATQVSPGVVALTIGVLVTTGSIEMWQLYILTCLSGVAQAINVPARSVLVYDVVGTENLTNAIALNSVVANISRVAAPSAGGAMITLTGTASAYYAQAVFMGLATVATLLLHPMARSEPVRTPFMDSIREGMSYTRRDAIVGRLVLLNVIPTLLIYPYVSMMPIFAEDVLDSGAGGFGILLTGVGFGSIPGGLAVAGMTQSRWKGRTMGFAMLLYMGMVFLFALSTVFVLSFAILVVAGVGWSMMVTLNQTLLQINVEDAYRGRVLSLYSMAGGFTPFGNLAMGVSADAFGVQAAVAAFALTGFAFAAVLGLGSRRVRAL